MIYSQQSQPPTAQNRWRIIGMVITTLLLILGVLWILSLLQVIDTSWAALLGTFFTIASGLLTVLFWLWPRPSTTPSALAAATSQAQGELEVLVRPELSGSTVYVDCGFHDIPPHNNRAEPIGERHNGNTVEYIAKIQALNSGNYTVSINANEPVMHVTIIAGQHKRIDWRRIHP